MSDPWQLIGERKVLDDESRAALVALYGTRGKKALDAIDNHLVKKYLDFFVVTGTSGNYVICEGVCTCPDFAFRQKPCGHLIAVRIAEATGAFETVDEWYQETWKGQPVR
jgi:predicted nucleic acid-binding Zn finger protein